MNNQKKKPGNYIFPRLATNMPQYTSFHWLCVTNNIANMFNIANISSFKIKS